MGPGQVGALGRCLSCPGSGPGLLRPRMDPFFFKKKNCSRKQTCSLYFVDTNVFLVFCINKRILCFAVINRILCVETRILCVLLA